MSEKEPRIDKSSFRDFLDSLKDSDEMRNDLPGLKSSTIRSSIMHRMNIASSGKSDAEVGAMLRGLENGLKQDMISAVIRAVSDLHLHQPYAFLTSSESECVGTTQFVFIMANTREDMEEMMAEVSKKIQERPLPKLADLPEKLRDRFTRYREATESLRKAEPKAKAVKIPVTDA